METATLTIARSVVHSANGPVEKASTKTGVARRVALDADTVEALRLHRQRVQDIAAAVSVTLPNTGFLFSDEPDGSRPWEPNRVTRRFIRLRDRLGLAGVRLHDLRHHLATRLLTAGIPVRTVSERLGYANANVTLGIYAHFVPASDREAAEVAGALLRGK